MSKRRRLHGEKIIKGRQNLANIRGRGQVLFILEVEILMQKEFINRIYRKRQK